MRLSVPALAGALAWLGVPVLIALATAIALRLGFASLFLFGVAGALICDRLKPDEQASATPQDAETEQIDCFAQLRAIRWCFLGAGAIGIAGFAWENRKP